MHRVVEQWRRLTLWPRLAIGVTIGFLVLFAGFSVLGIRAVDASTNRILHERLAITEELADDFDGLVRHRFADLAAFDPRPAPASMRRRLLAEVYHASGGAFTSVALYDARGRVVASFGGSAGKATTPPYVNRVLASGGRVISAPFIDASGRPVVALAVPAGAHGVLVGTLDLAGADVAGRLYAARLLGRTGHAELVDRNGTALASTEPGAPLRPGEHLDLYRAMFRKSQPGTANVSVTPKAVEAADLRNERHTMAFVKLSAAPWAVALGGTTGETYAPAHRLRRTLLLAGGGSLAVLWLLTLFGARLLVRPVRDLTSAAEEMASGNLDHEVSVSEGGEIGVLAASLETMRAQLRQSLETVRRWGEELELKVADRTAELNARNRQLAAVSAILAAANETHDLEQMLQRCLDVVLEHAGMDAAAVRLRDDGGSTISRGNWDGIPAAGRSELPLRGPSGDVGVLELGRRHGSAPPDERDMLAAISDQIAVAIDNTRLASELRRLEARDEVQRMRSELISAVSHELRTPLGFVKSYATTLLREDTPIEPATRRHFLEIIEEETEKLEHMIDELLDASRLQAGRLPIEPKVLSLARLVEHAVDKARQTLETSGHAVTLGLPDDRLTVLADAVRIEQVLDNLLENAARYSDAGSPVDVNVVGDNSNAVVTVTNRGDGIHTADLDQIFEPFFRGRNATSRRIRGAGLGLAISRGIVEAHGGKIWAETGRGDTTTFVVTLPLAAPPT